MKQDSFKPFKTTTFLLSVLSVVLLLVGCVPDPSLATIEVTRPITPEITSTVSPTTVRPTLIVPPLPRYIENVRPTPGSEITLEAYSSAEALSPYFSAVPSFTPAGSTICMALTYYWLALTGDTKGDLNTVNRRTTLEVNGQVITEPPESIRLLTLNSILRGDEETYFSAPTTTCWLADLGIGTHTVTYKFERTNGQIVEFTWQFSIVE